MGQGVFPPPSGGTRTGSFETLTHFARDSLPLSSRMGTSLPCPLSPMGSKSTTETNISLLTGFAFTIFTPLCQDSPGPRFILKSGGGMLKVNDPSALTFTQINTDKNTNRHRNNFVLCNFVFRSV